MLIFDIKMRDEDCSTSFICIPTWPEVPVVFCRLGVKSSDARVCVCCVCERERLRLCVYVCVCVKHVC